MQCIVSCFDGSVRIRLSIKFELFVPTAREGYVFTGVCLFTGGGDGAGYLWSQVPSWSLVPCPFCFWWLGGGEGWVHPTLLEWRPLTRSERILLECYWTTMMIKNNKTNNDKPHFIIMPKKKPKSSKRTPSCLSVQRQVVLHLGLLN